MKNSQNKSAILQMFYSHTGICDRIKMNGKELDNLVSGVNGAEGMLSEKLDTELAKLFSEYRERIESLRSEENALYYSEGFKFGLLMGMEVGEWSNGKNFN